MKYSAKLSNKEHDCKKPMRKIYTHLPELRKCKPDSFRRLKMVILPGWFWLIAHVTPVPGLFIHRYIFQIAIRLWWLRRLNDELRSRVFVFPMDSVRYFELDFMWTSLFNKPLGRYLDLSSPRLLPTLLLDKRPESQAILVNPDGNDLRLTRGLMEALGYEQRCFFIEKIVEDLDFPDLSFDTVTSVSVIEHIPYDGDRRAVSRLWKLLKPGGRLLLSVPCAAAAMEEYIDFNEYKLLAPDERGYVFGQRFYDQEALKRRIFTITGPPVYSAVYGEKQKGIFIRNREEKVSNPYYPYWCEPYMMGKNYRYYPSIDDLPGIGVIAMEFKKT